MTTPFNTNLKDQVAVVTGGGGVLGSYFCRALADAGAKVAVLGRTLESSETVASEIKGAHCSIWLTIRPPDSLPASSFRSTAVSLHTQVSKTGSYEQSLHCSLRNARSARWPSVSYW